MFTLSSVLSVITFLGSFYKSFNTPLQPIPSPQNTDASIISIDNAIITLIGTGSGIPDVSFPVQTDLLQLILDDYQLSNIEPRYLNDKYVMGYRTTFIKSSTTKRLNGYLRADAKSRAILQKLFKISDIKETIKIHVLERMLEFEQESCPISNPKNPSNPINITNSKSQQNKIKRKFATKYSNNNNTNKSCVAPVFGPDSWIATEYDIETDDCGFFTGEHETDNCYAYGCNIATNTYPQPGRGSGQEWTENTCSNMFDAAERDGLIYVGKELQDYMIGPSGNNNGHYVALYIWPNTNFHWARMDFNGTYNNTGTRRWSHKPGGTDVQITDNNGNCIGYPSPCVLPSQADLSPWSEFCGYMIAKPSQLTIE